MNEYIARGHMRIKYTLNLETARRLQLIAREFNLDLDEALTDIVAIGEPLYRAKLTESRQAHEAYRAEIRRLAASTPE